MKKTDTIQMGVRIRQARNNANLTQTELASSAGCALCTITRLENGQWNPKLGTIDAIAFALNTTSEFLLYGKICAELEKTS